MDHSVSDSVFKEWRQHVKEVSATGSLTLQHLTSDQAGVYTCEISSDEETSRRDTYLLVTEKHGKCSALHKGLKVRMKLSEQDSPSVTPGFT